MKRFHLRQHYIQTFLRLYRDKYAVTGYRWWIYEEGHIPHDPGVQEGWKQSLARDRASRDMYDLIQMDPPTDERDRRFLINNLNSIMSQVAGELTLTGKNPLYLG